MDFVAHFQTALPRMLADIIELVNCESPSNDAAALARSTETVARLGERLLDRAPDRYVIGGIPHLRWHWAIDRPEPAAACCCWHTTTRSGRSGRWRRTLAGRTAPCSGDPAAST